MLTDYRCSFVVQKRHIMFSELVTFPATIRRLQFCVLGLRSNPGIKVLPSRQDRCTGLHLVGKLARIAIGLQWRECDSSRYRRVLMLSMVQGCPCI